MKERQQTLNELREGIPSLRVKTGKHGELDRLYRNLKKFPFGHMEDLETSFIAEVFIDTFPDQRHYYAMVSLKAQYRNEEPVDVIWFEAARFPTPWELKDRERWYGYLKDDKTNAFCDREELIKTVRYVCLNLVDRDIEFEIHG